MRRLVPPLVFTRNRFMHDAIDISFGNIIEQIFRCLLREFIGGPRRGPCERLGDVLKIEDGRVDILMRVAEREDAESGLVRHGLVEARPIAAAVDHEPAILAAVVAGDDPGEFGRVPPVEHAVGPAVIKEPLMRVREDVGGGLSAQSRAKAKQMGSRGFSAAALTAADVNE
jgi:hypothetical protein